MISYLQYTEKMYLLTIIHTFPLPDKMQLPGMMKVSFDALQFISSALIPTPIFFRTHLARRLTWTAARTAHGGTHKI
jgi:hypothetical protein